MTQPTVVCLCGSTRFSAAYQQANLNETLAGNIVLTIGCDMRSDADVFAALTDGEREAVKERLDALHLAKIDMADEILVINCGGYVGDSTQREIKHALKAGKLVRWLESGKYWCVEYVGEDDTTRRMIVDTCDTNGTLPLPVSPFNSDYSITHERLIAVYGPVINNVASLWLNGQLNRPYHKDPHIQFTSPKAVLARAWALYTASGCKRFPSVEEVVGTTPYGASDTL